jgi:hypothetical protein
VENSYKKIFQFAMGEISKPEYIFLSCLEVRQAIMLVGAGYSREMIQTIEDYDKIYSNANEIIRGFFTFVKIKYVIFSHKKLPAINPSGIEIFFCSFLRENFEFDSERM